MPLTKSEREEFLWQLALLDFQRFTEVSSQALGDLISCIVLSAYGYDSTMSNRIAHSAEHRDHAVEDDTFQKLIVSCLLSANPLVRSLSMGIFSTKAEDCTVIHDFTSNTAIKSGCHEGDLADVFGSPNRPLVDVLRQVLQVNFEGLGSQCARLVLTAEAVALIRRRQAARFVVIKN